MLAAYTVETTNVTGMDLEICTDTVPLLQQVAGGVAEHIVGQLQLGIKSEPKLLTVTQPLWKLGGMGYVTEEKNMSIP